MSGRKDKVENGAAPEEPVKDQGEELAKELGEAKALADKYLDMARRLQADFDNYRKRAERDKEEYKTYACSSIVKDLLPIVDDLDRALASATEDSVLVQGVRGVRGNLMKVLEANGLKEMPAEGDFDPNLHEALCAVEGDEDGKIAEVYQKGYTLNGKVLRYAKVKVTKKAEAPETAPASEDKDQNKE